MPRVEQNAVHWSAARRLADWGAGLAWWWAAYLFLAGSLSTAQIVAGGLLSLGSVAMLSRFRRLARLTLGIRVRWVLRAATAFFRQLLPDTWYVTRALIMSLLGWRRLAGNSRRVEVDPGNQGPISAGRRAWLLVAVSWTPNTYAVCFADDGELVLHQLVDRPLKHSSDIRWPV